MDVSDLIVKKFVIILKLVSLTPEQLLITANS